MFKAFKANDNGYGLLWGKTSDQQRASLGQVIRALVWLSSRCIGELEGAWHRDGLTEKIFLSFPHGLNVKFYK